MMWPSSRFNRHNDVDFFFNKHFILNFETILQARLCISLRISGFVEEDVTSLWRLLNVRRETIEILYCCWIYLIDNIVVKYQPESVGFHYGDIVSSENRKRVTIWIWHPGHVTCWGRSRSVWPLPPGHTSCRGWRRHPRCWTAWAPGGRPPGVRPGTLGHQFPSLTESRWLPWCVCCIAQHI